jgi:hypothetical protein
MRRGKPLIRRAECRAEDDLEELILRVAASELIDIVIGHRVGAGPDLVDQRRQFGWGIAAGDRLTKLGSGCRLAVQQRCGGGHSERAEAVLHRRHSTG